MRNWLVTAAALFTASVMGLPAKADTCAIASVDTYTGNGTGSFSCSVGPVEFSNISVTYTASENAAVLLDRFVPFTYNINGELEYGLSLRYAANAGNVPGGLTDISWTYTVSALPGFLLSDAFLSLTTTVTGNSQSFVTETLLTGPPPGVTLQVIGSGFDVVHFDPVASLTALKDQQNFKGTTGVAASSILENGFSVTPVPGPVAGAGLPGLVIACGGLFALARRRRTARS
jgi:hypothetical protein